MMARRRKEPLGRAVSLAAIENGRGFRRAMPEAAERIALELRSELDLFPWRGGAVVEIGVRAAELADRRKVSAGRESDICAER